MSDQTQVRLPESVMTAIRLLCQDKMDPLMLVEAVIVIALGAAWYMAHDAETKLDPRQFAIPEEQWQEIAKALMSAEGLGLMWMNFGPSGYREAS